MRVNTRLINHYLKLESTSGFILLIMALIAMIWANSPLAFIHEKFIDASLFWINEGLMSVFFLVMGLELKRGWLEGPLSQFSQIILPAVAALGGMLIPVLIYRYINHDDPLTLKGWATPVATDIAFAIGTLSLFGHRVPQALKLFLLALAIFDDIGAIIIIMFFHSPNLSYAWLIQAAICVLALIFLNYWRIQPLFPYLFIGMGLWLCVLYSGVHPTIAGFFLALAIPDMEHKKHSPLHRLEGALHPWVAYVIMPLFALANAGFSLQFVSLQVLLDKVVIGIALGLFIGKQAGVLGFSWLFIQTKWAKLPEKSSWFMLYGVALLCGIGFTMSLFLGTLSFGNENIYLTEVRLGVIIGSILSGLTGALVLLIAFAQKER